jgi:hypothetical protein
MKTGRLRGVPGKSADTPRRKVREAEADLKRLEESERKGLGTNASREALSAFLSSSRSALHLLRRHSKSRFVEWKSRLSAEDQSLMSVLSEARNLETYENGPAIGVTIYVGGSPETGNFFSHRSHIRDSEKGEEEIVWLDACVRQMKLLRAALQAVTRDESGGERASPERPIRS